jgi:hypothetical protein
MTPCKLEKVIEPLTNYNLFVLDQRFSLNSSVTFMKLQTPPRSGDFRDANTSAVLI